MIEQRSMISRFLVLALLLPTLLPFIPTSSVEAASGNPWYLTTMGVERQAIYDMTIGEVDPNSPGPEIVIAGGGGIVNQYSSDTFEVKPLFTAMVTQQGVAIGDILAQYPGNEIVSVGNDQKVHLLHRESSGTWVAQTIWQSPGKVNGVTIGEFNATHPGKEIAAAGDEAIVVILNEDNKVPSGWATTVLIVNPIPITNMMCTSADILPEAPGDEILVGSFSGHSYLISWNSANSSWNITMIWRSDFAVVGFGLGPHLLPGSAPQIYAGDLVGKVELITWNGTNWTNTTLYTDPGGPIYALVPYDIDPRYPGPELITAGIGTNLHILRYFNGSWFVEQVADPGGDRLKLLYDVEIAELDASHPGPEIMIGGMPQELLMLRYIEPGFNLVPVVQSQTVVSGQVADLWFSVEALGYFSGEIQLTSDGGSTLSRSTAKPNDMVKVSIKTAALATERNYKVNVTGTSTDLGLSRTLTLMVVAKPSTTPGFTVELLPDEQTTLPGFAAKYIAQVRPLNGGAKDYDLFIDTSLPFESTVEWDRASPNPAGIIKITPSSSSASGTYPFVLRCKSFHMAQGGISETFVAALLRVDSSGGKDFTMTTSDFETTGVPNSTIRFELTLNPVYDFTDPVSVSVIGAPSGTKGSFTTMLVTTPATITYLLELGAATPLGPHILVFKASGGGKEHSVVGRLDVASGTKYGDFGLAITPSAQMVRPGGTTYFLLRTTGSYWPYETVVEPAGGPIQTIISPATNGNPDYRLMTVTAKASAQAGVYRLTVLGRAPWEHNATFTIIVSPDFPDMDLTMDPSEVIVSPGEKEPTFQLSSTKGGDILVGRPIEFSTLGVGQKVDTWVGNFSYSKALPLLSGIMQDGVNLKPGTYTILVLVTLPGLSYPKPVVGTIVVTEPTALIYITGYSGEGTPREGSQWKFQVQASNEGVTTSGSVMLEILVDGRSICRKDTGQVKAGERTGYLNCTWRAGPGDHNVTFLAMTQNDTASGRVMDGQATLNIKVYQTSLKGPAVAISLLFLVGGIAVVMQNVKAGPNPIQGPKPRSKDPSEEE